MSEATKAYTKALSDFQAALTALEQSHAALRQHAATMRAEGVTPDLPAELDGRLQQGANQLSRAAAYGF